MECPKCKSKRFVKNGIVFRRNPPMPIHANPPRRDPFGKGPKDSFPKESFGLEDAFPKESPRESRPKGMPCGMDLRIGIGSDSTGGIKTQIWIALIAQLVFSVIHRQIKGAEAFVTLVNPKDPMDSFPKESFGLEDAFPRESFGLACGF